MVRTGLLETVLRTRRPHRMPRDAARSTGRALALDAFPGSVGAEPEREYRRVRAERVEAHFTYHYVDAGRDFHAEVDAYPTDECGVAIFWRDVTARVEAEAALRARDAQYRTLFESIDQGFCTVEVACRSGTETTGAQPTAMRVANGA